MEFDLNEVLDIIESDKNAWCEKMEYNCKPECKYYHCICSTAADDIQNVRQLAAVCFHAHYEKEES